ncbi:MAG: L,D-transpeptidase family protein [Planctomycetota bacterium]
MSRRRTRTLAAALAGVTLFAAALVGVYGRSWWVPVAKRILGSETVASVVEEYGPAARARLEPHFADAGVAYPPSRVVLLATKDDARLELWAADDDPAFRLVHVYPILKLSGVSGPKLREGDRQVPEGVYAIEGLNPNSSYHLSMKLDYPNAFDLARAAEDGRDNPGSNIFIHGKALSVGCLAMGDPAIEELFVLVADVGIDHATCVVAPSDPRHADWDRVPEHAPGWTAELYRQITRGLEPLGLESPSGAP